MILRTIEVILQTNDVIFPQVLPELHFDKNERLLTGVVHAMHLAERDLEHGAAFGRKLFVAHRGHAGPRQHDPFFGTLQMLLQTETQLGGYFHALHLIIGAFV